MNDKKEPVEPSNLDAAPVLEEDRTGPDNALKDSDAHDDAGLHDKLQSPIEQDSDAQVDDKLQSPVEQDSDARDDLGLQDKLQSPAEQDPNWMEELTPEVRMRVQRLEEFQDLHKNREKKLLEKRQALEKKYEKKRQALENKYEKKRQALYSKRSQIVNGEVDVESNTYETAEEATSDEKATKVKGIPYFWLTAMTNHEKLFSLIKSHDEEALEYLKDIKYCTFGEPLNLKLDFFFDTNPFFTNSILTKTYVDIENRKITDAKSTGTEINWFPKKSLTHEIEEYKQRGRSKRKNIIERDSFFNFFGNSDVGIGSILYNEIIPKAVSWYTGEALEENKISAQEDSDEIDSSEDEDENESDSDEIYRSEDEEYDEDENESDGEASKKRTSAVGLTLRMSRRLQDLRARKSRRIR